jgi:hypothetical protein
MSNNKKILICAIIIVGCIIAWCFCCYFSYNNNEVSLRNQASAQIEKIEATHDKMWKIIQQKADVTDQYKEAFDSVYTHIMSERYATDDGSLMKWIKESNPEFDSSVYKDLSESIEVYRTEFQKSQERVLDIIREHKTLCETYPGKWFISDTSDIEYTTVSSTRSKTVMTTGLDDDVDIFKK